MIGHWYQPARLNGVGFVVLLMRAVHGSINCEVLKDRTGAYIKYDLWGAAQSHADSLNMADLEA